MRRTTTTTTRRGGGAAAGVQSVTWAECWAEDTLCGNIYYWRGHTHVKMEKSKTNAGVQSVSPGDGECWALDTFENAQWRKAKQMQSCVPVINNKVSQTGRCTSLS